MLQREAIGDVRSGFIAVKRVMDKDNLEPQVHGKKSLHDNRIEKRWT